jgi:hypothetical protein
LAIVSASLQEGRSGILPAAQDAMRHVAVMVDM